MKLIQLKQPLLFDQGEWPDAYITDEHRFYASGVDDSILIQWPVWRSEEDYRAVPQKEPLTWIEKRLTGAEYEAAKVQFGALLVALVTANAETLGAAFPDKLNVVIVPNPS